MTDPDPNNDFTPPPGESPPLAPPVAYDLVWEAREGERGMETAAEAVTLEEMGRVLAVVRWYSRTTGAIGHGKPIPLESAEAWVAALNQEHPDLYHWADTEHMGLCGREDCPVCAAVCARRGDLPALPRQRVPDA